MTKKILITGINGFAGVYLSRHLADCGYDVYGVSQNTVRSPDGAVECFMADLRHLSQVMEVVSQVKPTHVVHLAAISNVSHEDVREMYETNIVGTRNILKALTVQKVAPEAILLMSSANVYGNSINEILNEGTTLQPANDYGVSKVAMEYCARTFLNQLNVVIARPFNYTGRGQSELFLIPKIVNHFRRKEACITLGNTDVARDFSDVRTSIAYFRRLLETPEAIGRTFNVSSGAAYSLNRVIEICESITGHRLEVFTDPRFQRQNEVKLLAGDPTLLHNTVGQLKPITFEDTLRWMLEAPLESDL